MSKDYKIGFGRPPMHRRFKSGQSGNPKGRPKGSRNVTTELAEESFEPAHATERGRKLKISKIRAVIKKLFVMAVNGNVGAARLILEKALTVIPPEAANSNDLPVDDEALIKAFEARVEKRLKKTKGGDNG